MSLPLVREFRSRAPAILLGLSIAGLAGGGLLWVVGADPAAAWTWAGTTLLVLLPAAWAVARDLLRHETGVDLIAVLAMIGALALGQYLAGALVGVMLTSGTALERFAIARAKRELSALLDRVPRTAHRRSGEDLVDLDVALVQTGDVLVVRSGEVIPVDGIVSSGSAMLDESALTGEPEPVLLDEGAPVRSGGTNAGGAFELRATAPASEST